MVQFFDPGPTIGGKIGEGLGQGLGQGLQALAQNKLNQLQLRQKEKALKAAGLPAGLAALDPTVLKEFAKAQQQKQAIQELFGSVDISPKTGDIKENVTDITTTPAGKLRSMSDEQLQILQGFPAFKDIAKSELDRRQQGHEEQFKVDTAKRKETIDLRKKYADEARQSQRAIDNKELLLDLIAKGNLSHPLIAGIAEYLPKAVGNLLLTKDSQLYRSALFDEFGVLKNMFPGQIRVKEIELLEDKLADLYKNDAAKKEILKVGLERAKKDLIRAKAARKVEKEFPNLGLLEFEDKVEEIAAPEYQKLVDSMINEYNKIINRYSSKGKKGQSEMMIEIILPNGKRGHIPKENLKKALELGAKRA